MNSNQLEFNAMDTTNILNNLINNRDLTVHESGNLLEGIIEGRITPVQTAAILTALRMKGESPDEIVGLVRTMRKKMIKVEALGLVVDTCGTGGDGKGTINISTITAFVVSGAGVIVVKHGNRAASSLCGSADVLEALGVKINLDASKAAKVLKKVGMVFLFAPLFHPATKNVVLVRKELGVRTLFNFLGPLVNPAGVKRQLVGVPDIRIAKTLAKAATKLDYERILFVTSQDGTDEITLCAKTYAIEVKDDRIHEFIIDPSQFGFSKHKGNKISGGNAKKNAAVLRAVLAGEHGVVRDTVVINAAAALYVSGKASSIKDGIFFAEKSIDNGRAIRVLENLIEVTNKLS